MASELTCPKCQGTMRSYERNGIQIDQCTECRGVFLDRGELELLMDAEAAYSQASQQGRSAPSKPSRPFPGPRPQASLRATAGAQVNITASPGTAGTTASGRRAPSASSSTDRAARSVAALTGCGLHTIPVGAGASP